MRKLSLSFLLGAAALLSLPVTGHAYCYGVTTPLTPTPDGTVCGTVQRLGFNGYYTYAKTADTSYVKLCPQGSSPTSFYCGTTSTGTYLDGYNQQIQAWIFPRFRQNQVNYATYDVYAWGYSSTDYWGSSTKPIYSITVNQYGLEQVSLYMPPRPTDPTPVYPSGNSVGSSYTVRWKSGMDLDRSYYPVTYEVWYKYWPFGGTEPATYTLSRANMPCQDNGGGPDANNQCSTYVAGPQPSGNWKWYVVADLDVSRVSYANSIFSTQSGGLYFTEP